MSRKKTKQISDPLLAKVEPALRRAAQRAREIAERTNTPLVFCENGKIVLKHVNDDKPS